jgi:hypothetical protein
VVLRVEFLERILPAGASTPTLELELADLWGVTRGVVGDYAGEAWRRIASYHSPERSEQIRAEYLARIRFKSIKDRELGLCLNETGFQSTYEPAKLSVLSLHLLDENVAFKFPFGEVFRSGKLLVRSHEFIEC